MAAKFITLNINGLNCRKKQQFLFDFINDNDINIINLQEHNLKKSDSLLDIFYEYFYIFINESIYLKGGTAILVDKRLTNKIVHIEKSGDSRMISAKFIVGSQHLHILNIYSPSGSKYHQERENLFKNEILYYLRNNLSNTIICGDFNCITNARDKSKNGHCPISKSLQMTLNNLKLTDIWTMHHKDIQYTYFRNNYGSRLDRIYAAEFKNNISNIYVKPISISDHHCVIADVNLNTSIKIGRFYWKLNTNLLECEDIEEEFKILWNRMCNYKSRYSNINDWWDLCAKVEIRKFFQKKVGMKVK